MLAYIIVTPLEKLCTVTAPTPFVISKLMTSFLTSIERNHHSWFLYWSFQYRGSTRNFFFFASGNFHPPFYRSLTNIDFAAILLTLPVGTRVSHRRSLPSSPKSDVSRLENFFCYLICRLVKLNELDFGRLGENVVDGVIDILPGIWLWLYLG